MSGDILNLQITILTPNGEIAASATPRATDRVSELMARLILEHGLAGEPENWQLKFDNRALSLEQSLREVLPTGPDLISLTLTPTGATLPYGIPGLSGGIRPTATRATPPTRVDGVRGSEAPQQTPKPATANELLNLIQRSGVRDSKSQPPTSQVGKDQPQSIGKYNVLRKLGDGTDPVFLCEHKMMRRQVVLRVLPSAISSDRLMLDRFYREARAVAAVDHPNIARIYDIDDDENLHFLVMEYVDGTNLQEIVTKFGPLSVLRACHYIYAAAVGLQHAHEMGLIHRDIKPENILLDRNGIVKILGMGLARFFSDESSDAARRPMPEPGDYLGPEAALAGHFIDIRADISALGATFYFLLTGISGIPEGTVAEKLIRLQTHQSEPIKLFRSDVPVGLVEIIDKMTAKNPNDRYQSPAEVMAALDPWVTTSIPPPEEREMPPITVAEGGGRAAESTASTGSISSEVPRPAPMAPGAPQPAPAPRAAPAEPAPTGGYALPAPSRARVPSLATEVAEGSKASSRSETYARSRKKGMKGDSARVTAPTTTQRRATVRYYSRMNPDRVFPLLVMLTREEVEKVVKQHVEQTATGPLTLAKDVPLEIEPVLPGCQCHPPKVSCRVGDANDVFTFYVVPHVLGDITGARVLIRQDHVSIAEIKLEMRVVQRTLVVASGLSTFLVPAASAAMNHFGLDFKPKDGSSPYLAALNFLFGQVPPVVLTGVLALVTLGLYWFTRPKGRDVFFDISTKPPTDGK